MTAAVQTPDLVVRHVGDQFQQFWVFAEEMFAHIRAIFGFVGLVIAIDDFFHAFQQQTGLVFRQQPIPLAAPHHLDDVPACATEHTFQFLNDLAVAAHWAIQTLQVAVNDEDQIVQAFATGHRDRAQGFRLIRLAIAQVRPYLAAIGLRQIAVLQIAHEARLVNRHQRAETHRYRGELPEIRHQPRVRIRRQPVAIDFLAEFIQLLFADAAFHEGARIHAGRRVALEVHQVAAVRIRLAVEEVVEAHVIQGGSRSEAGDVAAQLGRFLIRVQHDGHRVPAHQCTDTMFHIEIAGRALFFIQRNRVDIGCGGADGQIVTRQAGMIDELVDQEVGAVAAFFVQYGLQ